jgi:hypothetical protein
MIDSKQKHHRQQEFDTCLNAHQNGGDSTELSRNACRSVEGQGGAVSPTSEMFDASALAEASVFAKTSTDKTGASRRRSPDLSGLGIHSFM